MVTIFSLLSLRQNSIPLASLSNKWGFLLTQFFEQDILKGYFALFK